MNQAKFEATVVNFKTTGKKTIVQLELTNSAAARNYMFLVGALDRDVHVQLGDPQASIEDFGIPSSRPGYTFKADASGIVERVVSKEADQEQVAIDDDQKESETEQDTDESETESEESEIETEETVKEDFVLEYDDQSDQSPIVEPEDESDIVVELEGKDDVETFILNGKAPKFEDVQYDFLELLKRKIKGETWMEIAASLKISSTTLSAAWSKYRKQVKAYMEGEEHGAA